MTDKHTPGPWEVGVYRNGVPGIVYCNNALGSAVAVVYGEKLPYSVFSREEEEANAHLIASAPAMLAALRAMVGMTINSGHVSDDMAPALNMALAVIKEATGETE